MARTVYVSPLLPPRISMAGKPSRHVHAPPPTIFSAPGSVGCLQFTLRKPESRARLSVRNILLPRAYNGVLLKEEQLQQSLSQTVPAETSY